MVSARAGVDRNGECGQWNVLLQEGLAAAESERRHGNNQLFWLLSPVPFSAGLTPLHRRMFFPHVCP